MPSCSRTHPLPALLPALLPVLPPVLLSLLPALLPALLSLPLLSLPVPPKT